MCEKGTEGKEENTLSSLHILILISYWATDSVFLGKGHQC